MSKFFDSELFGEVLKSVVGLGAGLIINNQNVQQAQGQANDQKEIANKLKETALANQRALELKNLADENKNATPPKSKTLLYVGLGVGGVVLIGGIIFAVTRK